MPMTFTLTTASTALNIATTTAVQLVPFSEGKNGPTGDHVLGDQIATIDVTSNNSGEAGVLVMFLYDPNTPSKVRVVQYTLSVPTNAYRASADGTSGNYVCVVSGPDLTNKLDLMGLSDHTRSVSASGVMGGKTPKEMQWYVGAYSMTGTSWTVYITPTRAN